MIPRDMPPPSNARAATGPSAAGPDAFPPVAAGGRFAALDSLRGVAALMVLAFHCWKIGLFEQPAGWAAHLWYWTPLNWLIIGRPWVILFFVLSGFVLSIALERAGASQGYAGFVLRRMCRIYLPFAASILFSAASDQINLGFLAFSDRVLHWSAPRRATARGWQLLEELWAIEESGATTAVLPAVEHLVTMLRTMSIVGSCFTL